MAARTVQISFLGDTKSLEASLARAGLVADETGKKIGSSFNEGTTKAGGALTKLGNQMATWGIPFSTSLENIGKKLDEANTKTTKFSTALAEAGKVALVAGGAGLAAVGVEAAKLGIAFQQSTAHIAATANISQKAATQIGNAFLGTAGSTIYSGQKIAAAYAQVAGQLGITEGHALSAAQALGVMKAAMDLAEGSGTDLTSATAALSTTMMAYHLSVGQAARASDTLFNVSRALNQPLGTVANALAKLHGRLGDLAPSMADVSGLMVELGSHGVQGTRGVSIVNTALQTLVGGSTKTKDVLDALGVGLFNQQGKFIGLQNVIARLQPKFEQMTQQQQDLAAKTLFGAGAAQVMLGVILRGPEAFQSASDAATRLGAAHQAAQVQSHTLAHEMETLSATLQDLGTKIGLWLIPKLQAMGQWLANGVNWLGKHKAAAEALAAVITGVLGLAVAAFAYQKAVAFVGAVKGMVGGLQTFASWAGIAGADTQAMATEVTAATAEVDASVAGMASATEAAGASIEATNVAIGASFTAMLGPIGAVVAAIAGVAYAYEHTQTTLSGAAGQSARGNYGTSTGFGGSAPGMPIHGYPRGVRTRGGFASGVPSGGTLSYSQLERLWVAAGGPASAAPTAAAIAMAESSGIDQIQKGQPPGTTGWGYWQITPTSGSPGPYSRYLNPLTNAQQAVALYRGRGDSFGAWTTYNDHAYQHFLQAGVSPATAAALAGGGSLNSSALNSALSAATSGSSARARSHLARTHHAAAVLNTGAVSASISSAVSKYQGLQQTATETGNPLLAHFLGDVVGQLQALGRKLDPEASAAKTRAELNKVTHALTVELAAIKAHASTMVAVLTKYGQYQSSGNTLLSRYANLVQGGSIGGLERALGYSSRTDSTRGSVQQGQFNRLVDQLRDAHIAALSKLADRLVSAHKNALDTLVTELAAKQAQATAAEINTVATQLKDMTTAMTNTWNDAVQGIKDAAQSASDAASAQVSSISDASQIVTDTLAERGLYGLNLQAQKQQVALDQMKSGWDSSIANATQAVDSATAKGNQAISAAQSHLDQVQASTDQAVGLAEQAVVQASTGTKAAQDRANAQLAGAQAQQQLQLAQANTALQYAQDQSNEIIAQANSALTGVQSQASIAEQNQQAVIAKLQAEASTQYAGSGLTINITGVPMTDAQAIASEVGWQLRTAVPV